MADRILDCDTIKRLRLGAGLSQSHLGDAIGVSQSVIRYLEAGLNHEQLNLRTVLRLAEVLGTDMRDILWRESTAAEATSDDVRVEALLADEQSPLSAQEIAAALRWSLRRARQALRLLRARLTDGGTQLRETNGGRWKLAPRLAVLSAEDHERLAQARLPRRGLTMTEARMLREVADGRAARPASRFPRLSERQALAGLLRMRLVILGDDGMPLLNPKVERSLHIRQKHPKKSATNPRVA